MRIVGSAWRWWQLRVNLQDGREWARRLLAHPSGQGRTLGRLQALAAAGGLAYWSMDYPATRAAYVERLEIAERLGEPHEIADAHFDLAFVGVVERDLALIEREARQAVEMFEALGDEAAAVRSRQPLVVGYVFAGDAASALALEEQNLAVFRRTQAAYRISDSLMLLSAIHRQAGDVDAARSRAREAIASMPQHVGGSTIGALGVLAIVEAESGDPVLAGHLVGAIQAIQAETGEALAPVSVLHLPDPADLLRERLGDDAAEGLIAEGRELRPEQAIALVLTGAAGGSSSGAPVSASNSAR